MDSKISISLGHKMLISLTLAGLLLVNGCANAPKEPKKTEEVLLANGSNGENSDPEYQKAALVNVDLGLGYLSQGQVARAKTKITHALKLAPNAPEPHSAMAFFLEQVGDIKEAEKEHKKALRLGSGKGAVYNNFGAFLCRQNRFKEADEAFSDALLDKNYPRTAEVYENAGVCAQKANDLDAAQKYLKTALQRDPKRVNALLSLTELSLKKENLNEAKNYFNQYKRLSEPTPRSLWLGVQLSHQLNDQNSVASQALLLKNLFEDSPEYQLFLQSNIGNS